MNIDVSSYERLGAFYLGREYDLAKSELADDLVLYDSKDLVTHGVVLGMTGSGKTGLCIAALEEAAMDGIPALVIDPKGDIANLLLTFPELRGADFRPWINEEDAERKGITPDEFAGQQAALWRQGLADWGQGKERIAAFRDKVDLTVYTPGSSAGVPVSILSSLAAPAPEVREDAELLAERVESTVSSLLSLLGTDADPIQDPGHILLSNIFHHRWQEGADLTLESLVHSIQKPPFERVGVLSLDAFYPEKKRLELAMKMNNLLASPGFGIWLTGEALDVQRLLHTGEGKPRISIMSIAHLSDAERMFFVSLLLNQVLGWMRTQSGTTSLRALLYMDEIFGFLPPTANPPSKTPLITLLKQARAFGLGVLLATQNPVDLDYKALSNIGTWFLGRLQTERDKLRVLDGLEGVAASRSGGFDRRAMEQILAGLGSRVFLMHNVHEDAPVIFQVRWAMSYLRGPLTRQQIRMLTEEEDSAPAEDAAVAQAAGTRPAPEQAGGGAEPAKPTAPEGVDEWFLPAPPGTTDEALVFLPGVLRAAEVKFSKSSLDVFATQRVAFVNPISECEDLRSVDWNAGVALAPSVKLLEENPCPAATFAGLSGDAITAGAFRGLKAEFADWIYERYRLKIFRSARFDAHSKPGESEGDFRARLSVSARERRDALKDELRARYDKQIAQAKEQWERAARTLDREKSEASSARIRSALSIGSTVLGMLMGRKSVSVTNMRRGVSAAGTISSASRQSRDVARAEEKAGVIEEKLKALNDELDGKLREAETALDPMTEELEIVEIKPFKKDIVVGHVGIVWLPHVREGLARSSV